MRINKKTYILISIFVLLVIATGGSVYYFKYTKSSNDDQFLPKSASSSDTTAPSNPTSDSTSPSASKPVVPISPASTPTANSLNTITINSPTQGATVTSGTIVSGKTNLKQVYFRLKGSKSGQLASGTVASDGVSFTFDLEFTNQVVGGVDTGVLDVYTLSTDGREENSASVSVNIGG